jgi:hypothetical protein
VSRRGRLAVTVRCDRAARVRLGGRVKLGRARVTAKPVTRRVRANHRVTLTLKLPKRALRALADHRRVSATLALRATNAAGTRVTTKRVRLRVR